MSSVLFPEISEDSQLYQVLVQTGLYGYVLFIAANQIGYGADLLLLVPSMAGLVGSIVLPILGAVPDGMMVLCSGLKENAQSEVSVGVGALAGSSIMLLTLPWFLSIYAGRVDITKKGELTYTKPADAPANWTKLTPGNMSLTHTGVSIGDPIKKNAKIMILTCVSYLLVQMPAFGVDNQKSFDQTFNMSYGLKLNGTKIRLPEDVDLLLEPLKSSFKKQVADEKSFVIAGIVSTTCLFFWYLVMMYKESKTTEGAVQEAIVATTVKGIHDGHLTLRGAMAQFRQTTWDSLCSKGGLEQGFLEKGSAAEEEVRRMCKLLVPFFRIYDLNQDNQISMDEFRMIIKDLREQISPEVQKKIFDAADIDRSGSINFQEFIACMMAFALDPNDSLMYEDAPKGAKRLPATDTYFAGGGAATEEEDPEEEDMPEDLADLPAEEQQRRIRKRAFSSMFSGTVLVVLFSDPMTDMLGLIGNKTGIPAFYISFILAPLASNASELVASMGLASKKTGKSMVQALSTLEGAAIMNNTFCLLIFFILIAWKGLVWKFTAETFVIVFIQIAIGFMAMTKSKHTLIDGIVILMMYPLSLGMVYVLENKNMVGWD